MTDTTVERAFAPRPTLTERTDAAIREVLAGRRGGWRASLLAPVAVTKPMPLFARSHDLAYLAVHGGAINAMFVNRVRNRIRSRVRRGPIAMRPNFSQMNMRRNLRHRSLVAFVAHLNCRNVAGSANHLAGRNIFYQPMVGPNSRGARALRRRTAGAHQQDPDRIARQ